jgi:UDP-N-acetyl-D-galactosamine dehydrogenase
VENARILIMGLTFKENCTDVRNTRVVDIVTALKQFNCNVDVYDPWVIEGEAQLYYDISPIADPSPGSYDAIVVAVAHDQFKCMGVNAIRNLGKSESVVYDLKYVLCAEESDLRL